MAIEIERPKEKRGAPWVWGLAALLFVYLLLPPLQHYAWDEGIRTLGILLMGWGGMFLVSSLVAQGRAHGWRNLTPLPKPPKGLSLLTQGVYAYVRHPLYFGLFLTTLGDALYAQNSPKIALSLALGVFLHFMSLREEVFLRATYSDYEAYARQVKRLVPGLY